MGIAIGCIGMSHDDFCKSTYGEFESITRAWREMIENRSRESWEQTRTMAAISIQPHIKKRITPRQLLPMPWDNLKSSVPKHDRAVLTAEERVARFNALSERLRIGQTSD